MALFNKQEEDKKKKERKKQMIEHNANLPVGANNMG
jgi:hypothetical protein